MQNTQLNHYPIGKYLSIYSENRLICNTEDSMDFYSLFELNYITYDQTQTFVCLKSITNKYLKVEDEMKILLVATADQVVKRRFLGS
jgi:hypothetical protein